MADNEQLSAGWKPNALFLEEARRFAEYRLTAQYRANEVEYKTGLGAVLRTLLAPDSLARTDIGARIAAFIDGDLELDELRLEPAHRAMLDRWPYRAAWLNLLAGGTWAVIQSSSFHAWATNSSASTVAEVLEDLLRGPDTLSVRFDRFLSVLDSAYRELAAQAKLKAREAPRPVPQLAAILLALTKPNEHGFFRPGVYQVSAESFGYPLRQTGTPGERYVALTEMLIEFRDGLREAGCPVDDLLDIHNLLWIRAKIPGWSGMDVDRWTAADFEAMRSDLIQDRAKVGIVESKLQKVAGAWREEVRKRTGRDFRSSTLGLYPPGRTSWSWVNVSLSERRFGSQPTARPQLNVEASAEGIDVFLLVDLRATAAQGAAVRERVRSLRGERAVLAHALDAGYRETAEDERGRYMLRRRIASDTAIEWPGLGIDELTLELDALLPVYERFVSSEAPPAPGGGHDEVMEPYFDAMAGALADRGQLILYGPPGTGKTWSAERFALWWLTRESGGDTAGLLSDPKLRRHAEERLTRAQREVRAWWIVANPSQWHWDELFRDGSVDYRYGRLGRNYQFVQSGDLVIGYLANPDKRLAALARVTQGLHDSPDGQVITLAPLHQVTDGLTYDELMADPVLAASEPARFRNQGTLFRLSPSETDLVLARLEERDPDLPQVDAADPTEGIGQLTRVTFHPTYGYEDFVEGFRPVPTTTGQLSLELSDGVFKRICQAARANPDKPYLLLIDEINRGNIPKILGELITVIERDKRDLEILLPLSGEPFSVPSNIYILATMNTADRSIRLLDAALRRRFSFIELMPTPSVLGDARVGELGLAWFLTELNRRITKDSGREKQIGQSFLLDAGRPVATTERFAARFRQEILPLLQEYAYDDFRALADYLGADLVDTELQRLLVDDLSPADLVAALAVEYREPGAAAVDEEG